MQYALRRTGGPVVNGSLNLQEQRHIVGEEPTTIAPAMRWATFLPLLAIAAVLIPAGWAVAGDSDPIEIQIEITDRSRLDELSRLVSIYDVREGKAFALASPRQLGALAAAGFRWRSPAQDCRRCSDHVLGGMGR